MSTQLSKEPALTGIAPSRTEPKSGKRVRIFLSYSHDNKEDKERLDKFLRSWEKQNYIEYLWDDLIDPGADWPTEIMGQIEKADIVLLLLTQDFLNSEPCLTEAKEALSRIPQGKTVIPVQVERTVPGLSELRIVDEEKLLELWRRNAVPKEPIRGKDGAADYTDAASDLFKFICKLAKKKGGPRTGTPWASRFGYVRRPGPEGLDTARRVARTLKPPKKQVVVLHGPFGVGKTEIAGEAARLVQRNFRDRLLWISASAFQTFTFLTLLDEAATALGLPGARELPPVRKEAEVERLLDGAATLIVLDDFHLVAPDEQRRCVEFLTRRPTCSAIITSREAWVAGGVSNVPVTAMTPDAGKDYLGQLVAQAKNQHAFADPNVVEDILAVTESNPLLLKWVVRLLDRAPDPADALGSMMLNEGPAAERVFEYAFGLDELGDDGRAGLLALSLFVVGAWRKALGEVAGIAQMRLNSVVRYLSETWPVRLEEGEQRVTLENLPRELLAARLAADPRAGDLRRAFVSYFTKYAEARARVTALDLDALEAERDNLLRAMSLAAGSGGWEQAMRLRETLDEFLYLHGHWGEALELARLAREAARSAGDELGAARCALAEARIRLHRAQFAEVEKICGEARAVFDRAGSEADTARVLKLSGDLACRYGRREEARKLYREAKEIQERAGDEVGLIRTLNSLGTSLLGGGARLERDAPELAEAEQCFERSRELEARHVNHYSRSITLNGLALVEQARGDRMIARILFEQSLELDKALGNRRGVAINLQCLGTLALLLGETAEARRRFADSLKIKQSIRDRRGAAITKLSLGDVAEKESLYDEARQWWAEARDEFRELGISEQVETAERKLAGIEGLTPRPASVSAGSGAGAPS